MRNVFEYLEYSFFTLFSKRFGRLVGSAILIDVLISLTNIGIIYVSLRYFSGQYIEHGIENFSSLLIQGLLILLGIVLLGFCNIGWKFIVIPTRSIEGGEKKFDLNEDFTLFRTFFSYYLSYITWYSLLFFLWMLLLIGGSVLFWSLELTSLIFFYVLFLFIVLVVIQVGLTFTWYITLLEPKYGLISFRKSLDLTKGRKWDIFKKIFVFSFILSLAGGLISGLSSIFPTPAVQSDLFPSNIVTVSGENTSFTLTKETLGSVLPYIHAFIPNLSIFYLLFRIEGVLSTAMLAIFLMRFLVDIREKK